MSEITSALPRLLRAPALDVAAPAGRLYRAARGWLIPAALVALVAGGFVAGLALRQRAALAAARCWRPAWRLTLSGELPRNVEVSFLRALAGLVVGGGIGFALGLANGAVPLSERADRLDACR